MTSLTDALKARFTDPDEIRDIANHGSAGGVHGFTYYGETRCFFFRYEDEIQDFLAEHDFKLADFIETPGDTLQTLIVTMVWAAVEIYCQDIVGD
jgi:hypothetical protein